MTGAKHVDSVVVDENCVIDRTTVVKGFLIPSKDMTLGII